MTPANTKLDLGDYHEMAKRNHRGLVPMVFVEPTLPHGIGDIAGFKPAAAKKLHDDGTAVPHKSVYDAGTLVQKSAASQVADETEEERRRSLVDLGENPLEAHYMTKLKMAKQIAGREVSDKEEAERIIRDEQTRREALVLRTGGAVTSESGQGVPQQAVA